MLVLKVAAVPGAAEWLEESGGSSPFVATNEFWVDNTIVDSPAFAALRMFSLIELALAYINGVIGVGEVFVIRLRESQTHVWDGTGWTGDNDGTIYGCGGSLTNPQAWIDVSANLTLAGSSNLTLRNVGLLGNGTAIIDPGVAASITLDNCYIGDVLEFDVLAMTITGESLIENTSFLITGTLDVHNATVVATEFALALGTYSAHNTSHSGGTRWINGGGENEDYTVNFVDCTVDEILVGESLIGAGGNNVTVNATQTTIKAVASGASYIVSDARGCTFTDVSFNVSSAAAGVLYLFSNGGLTQTLNDVRLSWVGPGTVGYHDGFVTTQNNGFTNLGTTVTNQPSGTYYNDGVGFVAVEP